MDMKRSVTVSGQDLPLHPDSSPDLHQKRVDISQPINYDNTMFHLVYPWT